MYKGRHSFVFLLSFLCFSSSVAQFRDTLQHRGFATHREAADTLFMRLLAKKTAGIMEFTPSFDQFLAETRKSDTITPDKMVEGLYLNQWGKTSRSFNKLRKTLKKAGYTEKKCSFDTLLSYKNTGSTVTRVELYIKQKKGRGFVKFQLWKIENNWYYTGKLDWVEEKPVKGENKK